MCTFGQAIVGRQPAVAWVWAARPEGARGTADGREPGVMCRRGQRGLRPKARSGVRQHERCPRNVMQFSMMQLMQTELFGGSARWGCVCVISGFGLYCCLPAA